MKKTRLILIIFFGVKSLCCQNTDELIRKTAIACKDPAGLNQNLYAVLKDFKFICLGEMHGTQEPAGFLTGLTRTFLSNNRSLIVAFEIDEYWMKDFIYQPDSLSLSTTFFFSGKDEEGKNSEAWLKAILQCDKPGVWLCYFDNSSNDRDLGMYEKLLEVHKADTNRVVLTLGGSAHNRLVPFNGTKTMACYLKEYFGARVCSINHIYSGGTMYNKTAAELKIHTLSPETNSFSTSTPYEAYYLPNVFSTNEYSGFFYTKTVSASLPPAKK